MQISLKRKNVDTGDSFVLLRIIKPLKCYSCFLSHSWRLALRDWLTPYTIVVGVNCLTCHTDTDIIGISGYRLQRFSITVGPTNGAYKKCGSYRNRMVSHETTAFMCEANARGNSVKIQIQKRRTWLTLCEVFIFGTGMAEVTICTVTNTL